MALDSEQPTWGAGATSLGAMIPIYEADSVEEAERLASALTDSAIPALVQQSGGELLGVMTPSIAPGGAWVVVPDSMRAEAQQVVRRVQLIPREKLSMTVLGDRRSLETDEDGPIEHVIPEAGQFRLRLVAASGSIAFFMVLQRGLEQLLGHRRAIEALGASSRHIEQWWRLVTASFVHSSLAHHFFNAVFGVVLGVVLFGTHGFGAAVLTWLVSSAVGLSAELWAADTPTLVVGASAGNYGLIGLWAKGQLDRARVSALPRRERLKTLGVLILLVPGALTPVSSFGSRTAVFAHVVGFLVGFVMGYAFLRRVGLEPIDDRTERRSKYALVLGVSLTACAFLSAALFLGS